MDELAMTTLLTTIQVSSAILLITAILLQQRGVGLGAAFGGEGSLYRTKRGVEKWIFNATIVLAILFFASALAGAILR